MDNVEAIRELLQQIGTKPDSYPHIKSILERGKELSKLHGTPILLSQWVALTYVTPMNKTPPTKTFMEQFCETQCKRIESESIYQAINYQTQQIKTIASQITSGLKCLECYNNDVVILYIPCGHIIACLNCQRRTNENCTTCGTKITEAHRIFL